MANIIYKINQSETDYNIASSAYCTCSDSASTVAKTANLQGSSSNGFTLANGVTIHVKFTNSNTAPNPTLNVNGTGAKSIMRYGTTAVSTNAQTSWRAGAVVSFTYDGTNWVMNTGIDSDTTYGVMQTRNLGLGKVAAYYYQSTATLSGGDFSTSPADSGAVKTITINPLTATVGRYYGVEADKEGRLFVNVPWEAGGGTTDSEKVKVSKIEHREDSIKYYKIGLISPGNSSTGGNLSVTSAEMAYLPGIEISSGGYMLGSSLKLSNSLYVGGDSSSSAFAVDGTNRNLLCSGNITVNNGYYLKLNKIYAPKSSNGTTYGYGSNGQVLKSNGSTVYWASDSTGTDNDKKTSSSEKPDTKLFLIGATIQSTTGQTTYSNNSTYIDTDNRLYNNCNVVVTSYGKNAEAVMEIVTTTQAQYDEWAQNDELLDTALYIIVG